MGQIVRSRACKTRAAIQRVFRFAGVIFAARRHAWLTCVAVGSRPALQTRLVAVVVAGVVAEELVPRPAELVAAEAVVVLVAADPDLVLELGHEAVVHQLLPVRAGVDHAGVRGLLDQFPVGTLGCKSFDTVNDKGFGKLASCKQLPVCVTQLKG